MWNRRSVLASGAATAALAGLARTAYAQSAAVAQDIHVDLTKTTGPLDHIWSKCAGSDRAAITMRDDWRKDLVRMHNETGLERVRFHGIFADEMGVYAPSIVSSKKVPNWQNVDRVYDGLIERGVRPYVELSFMPKFLASKQTAFGFYNANSSPPTSMADWGDFVKAFAQHLVDRYGVTEVRQWPFEVWNEPNLSFFWSGTQADYFEFYKATALALKSVDAKLMVGGPSTSAIQWIPEFLEYCKANSLPLDFVGTHMYAGDKQEKIFGQANLYSQNDAIPKGMAQVRAQIEASAYPGIPLWLSEWSSDSPAMIVHIIKGCLPYCQGMSHWTFSNTYEELGVSAHVIKEGDNGYGMIAAAGIPKPQFNTYKLLHQLGHTRLTADEGPVLASRRADGSAAIAVWNLAEVPQAAGIPGASLVRKVTGEAKSYRLIFKGARAGQAVKISYVDQDRGSPYPAWRKLGSPQYPTIAQIDAIRKSAELAAPQTVKLSKTGELILNLPPEGVALIEITRS